MTGHAMGTRELPWVRIDKPYEFEPDDVYSTYGRGTDVFNTFYQLLDRASKGRDEDNIPPGEWWWRRHDEYGEEK